MAREQQLEQAERASRAQTRALIRTIERLTRDESLAELPGIVLAAIVDQLGASGGTLYEYDEVTDVCSMLLDYEEGRVLTPDQMGHSARKAVDHNNIRGWEQVKAQYLRGECILATGR